jgi:hypothetical protein
MAVELEARPYGPESTPEEIQTIRDRVYVYSGNVVMYYEVPVPSVFQLDLFGEKMEEVTKDMDSYDLLLDLTVAIPPHAEIRARLKRLFSSQAKMRRAAAFTGRNFMLNVAAKFVLGGSGLRSFSVHKTMEQALAALRA